MSKKKYKEGRKQALEQIIRRQQEAIEAKDLEIETKNIIIDSQSKKSDQYLMTAKYLTHIFLLMETLDKILENNGTMGVVVKQAMLDFMKRLSEGMLQFTCDGDNVTFNPNNVTMDAWNG